MISIEMLYCKVCNVWYFGTCNCQPEGDQGVPLWNCDGSLEAVDEPVGG